jgi:hypothetical protein
MALIISNKYKYIFFHLPKNAGTSVSNKLFEKENFLFLKKSIIYLLRAIGNKKRAYNFYFCNKKYKFILFNSHSSVREIENTIHHNTFESYYKFAIIRNPFDRFVSRFLYFNKIDKNFKYKDFKQFILWDLKHEKVLKQKKFLLNNKGVIGVDSILRFENIDLDFTILIKKLNLNYKVQKLKKLNSTSNKNYRDFYNIETKKIVEEYAREDLEFFNYSF